MLPEEPAGAIPTPTAGAAEFTATLTWRSPEEAPTVPLLPKLPGIETGAVRCSISEAEVPEECTRRVSARIMALSEENLTAALDAAMRTVNETAASTEALLEARSVRLASPLNFPASTRKRLARDLKEAGFESCFAPAWTPIPGTVWGDAPAADIALGTRGADREFRDFLEGHPSWKIAS